MTSQILTPKDYLNVCATAYRHGKINDKEMPVGFKSVGVNNDSGTGFNGFAMANHEEKQLVIAFAGHTLSLRSVSEFVQDTISGGQIAFHREPWQFKSAVDFTQSLIAQYPG